MSRTESPDAEKGVARENETPKDMEAARQIVGFRVRCLRSFIPLPSPQLLAERMNELDEDEDWFAWIVVSRCNHAAVKHISFLSRQYRCRGSGAGIVYLLDHFAPFCFCRGNPMLKGNHIFSKKILVNRFNHVDQLVWLSVG